MLTIGSQAPDFTLPADDGRTIRLSDFRSQYVVLYFYPKDNTPGCTKEACAFRDTYSRITQTGAVVLGISPDSVQSHSKFKLKLNLPFALLSDPDHHVAELYGVWGEKRSGGKTRMGIH